ncbi:MAG TPA: ATP-binding cassette domain-containing protein [Pseudolysinimonas sp.]|jgi:energy-coupling factor transport system ATP-binding protein
MRRDRLVTLRTTALVAVGFVALRVVYRVIFGGGSGDGVLLLDPPRVPLGGPFTGIILFGPVTTGGIATAALSAMPFAVLIVVIGFIGVIVDLRSLLVRGSNRGPLRTISRTLVVAISTFPALRDAVARVRVARELRGERSLASLLVPVLEQTVERAIALGASMEVRGFAATRHPDADPARPVAMTDVALGFADTSGAGSGWILDPVDLALAPGTLTLVTGATGSGKSTLLDAMSGLFQHLSEGRQDGEILVGGLDRWETPPRETADFIGVVPQAVRLSFVASTVTEELGFAMATRGIPAELVDARVREVAEQLGIGHLLGRPITALSAGEACLVAIGGAVVSRPGLLLLDEPLADLDASARERVLTVIGRLVREQGMCVVAAEHSPDHWGDLPDQRLELRDGTVRVAAAGDARADGAARATLAQGSRATSTPIARIRQLSAAHGATVAVDAVSLELCAGERSALVGPNGAGKSTLLLEMALPRSKGTVIVDGLDVAALSRAARRRAVALVPEAFDDLLFATTVAQECARADRHAAARGTAGTFLGLLGIDDPAEAPAAARSILDRHPRDLSAGQRLCLVIAIQLSARPRVLLIDEPTRGLDPAARSLVGVALSRIAADGTAVLFATHDAGFAERYASHRLAMVEGRVTPSTIETTDAVAR